MPDYKEILYEKQRGGVLITLNRPEALNAITRPMLKEIASRPRSGRSRSGDPRRRHHRRRPRFQLRFRSGDDERSAPRYSMALWNSNRHERRGSDELLERRRRQADSHF